MTLFAQTQRPDTPTRGLLTRLVEFLFRPKSGASAQVRQEAYDLWVAAKARYEFFDKQGDTRGMHHAGEALKRAMNRRMEVGA